MVRSSLSKLSRLSLRKLASGQKVIEQGIVFERLLNGDGRWSFNIMVDGVRIHRTVGLESDGVTREYVQAIIEKLRTEAREGRLGLPKGRKVGFTFNVAANLYLEELHKTGGKDLINKRTIMERHLIRFFGSKPIDRIESADIDRYKAMRLGETTRVGGDRKTGKGSKERPIAKATVHREVAVLSHFLNKAVEWKWIKAKPPTKGFKLENAKLDYLTGEQVQRVLEVAKRDRSFDIYPFLLVATATGMRLNEILSVRWEHIDLDRRLIHIPKAKAGSRDQPVTKSLAEYLSGRLEQMRSDRPDAKKLDPVGWLFPSHRDPQKHMVGIQKPFRRVIEAAGLDPSKITRHTLRHTAITHLVQAGVDLPTVQRISGHKSLQMVSRYAHQNAAHIENAMDQLEERLSKLHRNYTEPGN